MVRSVNGENIRAYSGTSKDVKPRNIDDFNSVGKHFYAEGVLVEFKGPRIGQGSTYFEVDTQKVYMYVEGEGGAELANPWVEIATDKIQVVINAR